MLQHRRRLLLLPLLGTLLLVAAPPARAGELTLLATVGTPSSTWKRGYGASLSSTWFEVISLEGEAVRIPGEDGDSNMTSFTVAALLAPPIGALVPYGGLGFGLFRQATASQSDTGKIRAFILGAKLKLGVVVLKAEYRKLALSGEPLFPMDTRYTAGAGISF